MGKKIKIMTAIWSMKAGGAQQIVLNYLRYFQNDPDIDFWLYVYTEPTDSKYDREIAEKKYNVVYLNNPMTKIQIPYIRRHFQHLVSRKVWEEAIRQFRPDIIHIHISPLLIDLLPGIEKNNITTSFSTLHGYPLRFKGYIKKVMSNAFKKGKVIPICITNEQAEIAKKWYGFQEYELIRNGIDVKYYTSKCISREEARKRFGITDDAFVICGVGRLAAIKNYPLLIEAFSMIKSSIKNAILLIAGEGKEEKKLKELVKNKGLDNDVVFLGSIDNTVELYCAADVLALTSFSEASPLVPIEAQVCGLRCVISYGSPKESIISQNSRRMPEKASAKLWADALINDTYNYKPFLNSNDYDVDNQCKITKQLYLQYYDKGK